MTTATLPITALLATYTAADAEADCLLSAAAHKLDTTAWQDGSPERTLVAIFAHVLATRDGECLAMGKGGLLRWARGAWLTMLARDVYGVTRPESSYATAADALTITNAGGGEWLNRPVGSVTVKNTATGKTYHNANVFSIAAGPAVDSTCDLVADEAGTGSNSAAGEINAMVTTYLGCTCVSTVALVGTDATSDDELVTLCELSLGAVSPNGAAAAYEYVARTTLRADGSTVDINRVHARADAGVGWVEIALASSSGEPAAADVTLVDTALQTQCVPLTATCDAYGAEGIERVVTATLYVPDSCPATDLEIKAAVDEGLAGWFSRYPIGGRTKTPGGSNYLFADAIRSRICAAATFAAVQAAAEQDPTATAADVLTRATDYDAFSCTLASNADLPLAEWQVATLGTVTLTITRVAQ